MSTESRDQLWAWVNNAVPITLRNIVGVTCAKCGRRACVRMTDEERKDADKWTCVPEMCEGEAEP